MSISAVKALPEAATHLSPAGSSLLALDDTGERVRPLRNWGAADRTQVAEALDRVVQAWALCWPTYTRTPMASVPIPPSAQDLGQAMGQDPLLSSARWGAWGPDEAPACWWTLQRTPLAQGAVASSEHSRHSAVRLRTIEPHSVLLGMLFGEAETLRHEAPEERVSDQLADRAWIELRVALAATFDTSMPIAATARDIRRSAPTDYGLPQTVLRPWEGALLVRLPWCGVMLTLVVAGAAVARWLQAQRVSSPAEAPRVPLKPQTPANPPAAVLEALDGARVAFDLRLESVEVSLGALATLRVGDILCTTHDLETPLRVHTRSASDSDDAPVCTAFLGRKGSRRAIELLPSDPPARAT